MNNISLTSSFNLIDTLNIYLVQFWLRKETSLSYKLSIIHLYLLNNYIKTSRILVFQLSYKHLNDSPYLYLLFSSLHSRSLVVCGTLSCMLAGLPMFRERCIRYFISHKIRKSFTESRIVCSSINRNHERDTP